MYAIYTEYKAPYLQIGIVVRARGGSGRGSLEEGYNFFTPTDGSTTVTDVQAQPTNNRVRATDDGLKLTDG